MEDLADSAGSLLRVRRSYHGFERYPNITCASSGHNSWSGERGGKTEYVHDLRIFLTCTWG